MDWQTERALVVAELRQVAGKLAELSRSPIFEGRVNTIEPLGLEAGRVARSLEQLREV